MILDNGMIEILKIHESAQPGLMPRRILRPRFEPAWYGELNVGYRRQYTAMGVGQQVDKLLRIWQERGITIGMHAILYDDDGCPIEGEQYRIDNVQHLNDEHGEAVTHLTLRRLDKLYDIHR